MADFNHDNVLESNQGGRNFFLNGYSYIKKKLLPHQCTGAAVRRESGNALEH